MAAPIEIGAVPQIGRGVRPHDADKMNLIAMSMVTPSTAPCWLHLVAAVHGALVFGAVITKFKHRLVALCRVEVVDENVLCGRGPQ